MADVDPRFEEFRYDFIAHLAARFGLTPEVVTTRLGAWLLDREHSDDEWCAVATGVRPSRPRA
ncbi:MAG TPA: hypothetical protein VHB79_16965 [Polyangiaceae bacterium]|nr:hypothetical protein [Polyangiaceae bacterium]